MKTKPRVRPAAALTAVLAAILALGLPAAAFAQEESATAQFYSVPGSETSVTGSATIAPAGEDATLITVRLEGYDPDLGYPAHLHEGTYDLKTGKFDFNPKPSYDLSSVFNGVSETRIEVPFEELTATDYLIAAHLPDGYPGQGAGTDVAGNPYGRAIIAGPIQIGAPLPDTGGPALPSATEATLLASAVVAALAIAALLAARKRIS